jgi:hypothetical protein
MAGIRITRWQAKEPRRCLNGHDHATREIAVGDFSCHVDLAPGQPRRGSDWGYVDSYCEPCGTVKYFRYRAILGRLTNLGTGQQ